jgi:hypothetical protein
MQPYPLILAGHLVKAILLIEAAVQKDRENPQLWEELGLRFV